MVKHRKQALKWIGAIQDAGRMIVGKKTARALGDRLHGLASSSLATPAAFKTGGMVHKGGWAKVHKGELVLTPAKTKALKSILAPAHSVTMYGAPAGARARKPLTAAQKDRKNAAARAKRAGVGAL